MSHLVGQGLRLCYEIGRYASKLSRQFLEANGAPSIAVEIVGCHHEGKELGVLDKSPRAPMLV